MIKQLLHEAIDSAAEQPLLHAPSGSWTYQRFLDQSTLLAAALTEQKVVVLACYMPDSPRLLSLMAAAAISGTSICIFNRDYSPEQIKLLANELDVDLIVTDRELELTVPCKILQMDQLEKQALLYADKKNLITGIDADLLIMTSGTTGTPKCVRYRWSDIAAQVKRSVQGASQNWLLTYHLNHFAGIQMFIYALVNRCSLVLAESNSVTGMLKAAQLYSATHISATPTFWRFAIAQMHSQPTLKLSLQHITLGSEAVTSSILSHLTALFPDASISQIYAATELGSCVSVTDRKPGLPLAVLDRCDDHDVQFKIKDGELYVKAKHGMRGYVDKASASKQDIDDQGWRETGDLVRIENNRILFLGRKTESINVGGVKVHPLEVEDIISQVPGVHLAHVYGRDNPIMGQIVAVNVVLEKEVNSDQVEDAIFEACTILPRHSRPKLVQMVDSLDINNYKLSRKN
ncbi:class I adenylate-forming enzyme family protein [Oceanicoccus sp. KOV_DT_Chl]|uniref:class I adenylate-forming enzyme family protein n=1 Tax=Oceanicoccus sp. KOV_DT_Chl TaxID=1904639 RepID=UPI000C79C5C0|nr:class I adenylate-forming enzyme family protein [Oceanicoccus sp. KOV_DT_Chl]